MANFDRTVGYAEKYAARLPNCVDKGAVVGAACLGLVQAAKRWQPQRGLKWYTFAMPRIRGAMLDELREQDILPRTARDKGIKAPIFMDIDGSQWEAKEPSPVDLAAASELRSRVRFAVSELSAQIRRVIRLYYFRGLKLRDVGKAEGIGESRVCQLMRNGRERLRGKLASWHTEMRASH